MRGARTGYWPSARAGLTETFAHDGLDRLLTATAKRGNSSADLRKLTTAYGTDRLGNHTALASSVTGDPKVTGMAYGARTNPAAPEPHAVTAATVGGVHTKLSYDAAGHAAFFVMLATAMPPAGRLSCRQSEPRSPG